ncbi:hypothetical protein SAMN06265222_10237 [Neorhodopirellula lusitana]|uniref:SHOCT domain-containing protein n=1 Tax=Neorhodopirellula lusitana TaxID=445327 RepID=A0ABY1PUL8_9BACT|nr:hypothetical protein [Neorhodopirellula lusitana]SMP45942.1 hypothetical protein SAMN06265222_10237 [Neorhodopirellula lusitana]
MTNLFANPAMQLGLALTVLVIVIAIAFWLLGRLRDYNSQAQPGPLEGLSNLEEMLRKGDISEKEFRTIQASARAHLVSSVSTKTQNTHSNVSSPSFSASNASESVNSVNGEKPDTNPSTTS